MSFATQDNLESVYSDSYETEIEDYFDSVVYDGKYPCINDFLEKSVGAFLMTASYLELLSLTSDEITEILYYENL